MSADAYADLDRAHSVLRQAAARVVKRWEAFLVEEDTNVREIAERQGIDLAGVGEAVALLDRELQNRVATRPA